jgi:anti-sigma-28 factor FlgM
MYRHGPSCLEGPVSESLRQTLPIWCGDSREMTFTSDMSEDPKFRADLVARIRKEIAAGTYETPQRWEAALDALFYRLQID